MAEGKCAIWGTEAKEKDFPAKDVVWCDSPRAGGKYQVSYSVADAVRSGGEGACAKFTTWLVNQRRSGSVCPELLDTDLALEIIQGKFSSTSERIDRFFLYCESMNIRLGQAVYSYSYAAMDSAYLVGVYPSNLQESEILAWTECLDWSDFVALEAVLKKSGLLEERILSLDGFRRMEELAQKNISSKQAFVAMWFDPNSADVFREGIRPAIEIGPTGAPTGFKAVRTDHEHYSDFFMIGSIRRSRFVVADFTSFTITATDGEVRQIPRGGVYFEAGFAKGLDIPVIATCREDQKSEIHFDLKQFNTIYWKDVADLRKQLSERIFAMFVT